jgi:hypothetical protein
MPNAVDILSRALVEYPKRPTTGNLLRCLTRKDDRDEHYSPDNTCACLLGHLAIGAGVPEVKIASEQYFVLYDGNGIEEAIRYLALAINPEEVAERDRLAIGDKAPTGRIDGIVYSFNDAVLQPMPETNKRKFTPESIAKVTAKIQEALDLAIKTAALAEIEAAEEAVKLARADGEVTEDSNPVKILKKVAVEYPKSPATGTLVYHFKQGKDCSKQEYDPKTSCACLLGHVGLAGDIPTSKIVYEGNSSLYDGNGVEEAIVLLARVIRPDLAKPGTSVRRALEIVCSFNDCKLVRAGTEDGQVLYTPESVFTVVAKVYEAIALGEKEQAAQRESDKSDAIQKALSTAQTALATAKGLVA